MKTIADVNALPLRDVPQWVLWRLERRKDGDKPTKVPYQRDGQSLARVNDPSTWTTQAAAIAACQYTHADGVGFVIAAKGNHIGIDLDHCLIDGSLLPWARVIVEKLASYTEISPSGTGLHIIVSGQLPGMETNFKYKFSPAADDGDGGAAVEIYWAEGHYLTMTGRVLSTAGLNVDCLGVVRDGTKQVAGFYRYFRGRKEAERPKRSTGERRGDSHQATAAAVTVAEIVQRIVQRGEQMKNGAGERFLTLWSGKTLHGGDDSADDLGLVNYLAVLTGGDMALVDTAFRQSGLYRPKWERGDYRKMTLDKGYQAYLAAKGGAA